MGEEKKINIDSTNIFDEFGVDTKLKKEIETLEKEKKKKIGYYLSILISFFTTINIILLLLFIILLGYFFIQNNEKIKNVNYLNLICDIIIDDKGEYTNCSSVSSLIDKYYKNNNSLKEEYYKKNLLLMEDIYTNISFINSREVSFLIKNTKDKLKVLEMLSEFDRLKNDFSPLNKSRILCSNIKILSDSTLDIICTAYSGSWDSNILGYSGLNIGQDKVKGTSISIASSFINFIEKRKNPKLTIISKPKQFASDEIINNNGYTKKTDFILKLKYNNILLQNK